MSFLFNMEACKKDSPRIEIIKNWNIVTNYSEIGSTWEAISLELTNSSNIPIHIGESFLKPNNILKEEHPICYQEMYESLIAKKFILNASTEKEAIDLIIQSLPLEY